MENEIRPADKPIRECLLPSSYQAFESEDEQLKRALEESRAIFEFTHAAERSMWEIEDINNVGGFFPLESEIDLELQHAIILSRRAQEERETRTKQVASFKSRFTQFMQIDKPNKEFYSDMIRYVEKYEYGDLTSVSIGEEYYVKFLHIQALLFQVHQQSDKNYFYWN